MRASIAVFSVLAQNIKGFAKMGATNYFPEGEPDSNGGEMAELKTYLITKLLWDPSLNATALVHEFISLYYGAAAPMMQRYIDSFAEAAAPSAKYPESASAGHHKSVERRFAHGECVRMEDRPWAKGCRGRVSGVHADGTYEVKCDSNDSAEDADAAGYRVRDGHMWLGNQHKGGPAHSDVVSWVYLHSCGTASNSTRPQPTGRGEWLYSDMMAESCGVVQNGSHNGWACGYLTPGAILRGLRAQVAAAAAPGLTEAQAARVRRSSLSTLYVSLVKWEELRAYSFAHPEQGGWPLSGHDKESAFAELVTLLKWAGVVDIGGAGHWTEAWLRDRIFYGNATGC